MNEVRKRLIFMVFLLCLAGSACDDDPATGPSDTGNDPAADSVEESDAALDASGDDGAEEPIVVGVSWANYQEVRWSQWDGPSIRAVVEAAGATYLDADATGSPEKQVTDLDDLIDQGANVLIVLAQDSDALLPAVQDALDQGIPVVAYDRLIDDPRVFYLTFDNVEVGRMQARAILEQAPSGNYVILKGDSADPNSDFFRAGQQDILAEAIDSGDIVIVGEAYTPYWSPEEAQILMEGFLGDNENDIDAVVAANDGLAGAVVAALDAQGLAGQVPVSGQDADWGALNRIALGIQTVTVWKDARALGGAAGEIAIALAQGSAPADIPDAEVFESPAGNAIESILLDGIPITQDNLHLVIEAEWITTEELCVDVPPGTVAACP